MRKLQAAVGFLVARSSRELDRLVTAVKIRWRSRPNARAARTNKIFIAGCARSGTTLTQRVMESFEDTFVWPPEARHTKFYLLDRQESNLVIKRDSRAFAHLAKLPADIGLIYCVRHPLDVLTSVHPQTMKERRFHTTADRWVQEYDALLSLRKAQPARDILYLRYEDTIADPDAVQQRIANRFGLRPRVPVTGDGGRPIHARSLRKWERNEDYRAYLQSQLSPAVLGPMRAFCREFGYDMPAWAGATG
ncbi:sulfotransferase [Mesorhizobium sp. M2C.T.Ca.TU.002.02.1.1]|uniref:sulfotransferase family protein n=1 Tax=Mesorhizobium sp. M2C.T.Ca.TU.002.02.1.1 TaxID=2496788 RepID=UPI001FE06B10|nr:sulfotransferase [Mesorhizobium sp. M2C.T.Ca.TU.002.02.1.1]